MLLFDTQDSLQNKLWVAFGTEFSYFFFFLGNQTMEPLES